MRKLVTPKGIFRTLREAAVAHNTRVAVIAKKANSNHMFHQGYYWVEEDGRSMAQVKEPRPLTLKENWQRP